MGMNQGNWGALIQGGISGAQTEQQMQGKDYENQVARQKAGEAGRLNQDQADQFEASTQAHNIAAANNNMNPANQQMPYQNYSQQSGGVFDPARNAIHNTLANIGRFYHNVFNGQQGQSNPAAAQAGNPNAHAAGPAAQQTTQQPGNQAMSRPQPTSSNGAGGQVGATGPMPLPSPGQDQVTGRTYPGYAEGGAIPGRKLAGIRRKPAKPGNIAKATAGDKQVAQQQPGQEMPPRNTEPGAGISNQDPQLADGGKPKKWIAGAIKHPGALHKELGVPEGEKIPKSKIKSAEGSDNPKLAKRAQLAETMSHFKDGGLPQLPKLQPGAAPAPKPAPRSVEQDVSNDGMRHYLGKTIKRFADGGDPLPNPAGLKLPPHEDPSLVGDLSQWNAQQPEYAGMAPPGTTAPPSPGKGASPPQTSMASAATGAQSDYAPEAPGKVPESKIPAVQQVEPNSYDQNIRGPQLPAEIERGRQTVIAAREAGAGAGNGPSSYGPAPESGAAPGAPAAAGTPHQDAPVDFGKIQVDQSQVPTMSTQDWQMMHDSIRRTAVVHGMSMGQADIEAGNQISTYQHQNFMQYMQQAAALDASGNKQGAMAAMKTAYQFFPTGHDMHFGLDPTSHDIIGYGVNEQTGQPVPNGAIHLNQQNIHGIITHFSNPENFVNEGIRMQQVANETAKTKGEIGLMGERGRYLHDVNPTRLAGYELRAQAADARANHPTDPRIDKLVLGAFNGLPDQGGAERAASLRIQQAERQAGRQLSEPERSAVIGEVRHFFDPSTPSEELEGYKQKYGLGAAPQQANSAVPNRGENPYVLMNALSGG